MAKEMHPDRNPDDPNANAKFQDLGAAYETLSDPDKRKLFDRCGEECVQKEMSNGGGGGDPFASFFGDFGFNFFGGENPHGERETPRGANIVMDLWVTLEELYVGNFVEVSVYRFSLTKVQFRNWPWAQLNQKCFLHNNNSYSRMGQSAI